MTIFVTWQLRVTLDSICNSCFLFFGISASLTFHFALSKCANLFPSIFVGNIQESFLTFFSPHICSKLWNSGILTFQLIWKILLLVRLAGPKPADDTETIPPVTHLWLTRPSQTKNKSATVLKKLDNRGEGHEFVKNSQLIFPKRACAKEGGQRHFGEFLLHSFYLLPLYSAKATLLRRELEIR